MIAPRSSFRSCSRAARSSSPAAHRPLRLYACGVAAVLAVPALAGAAGDAAAPEAPRGPSLAAVRADHRPEIDGRVDDAAWQRAVATTAFTQKFPDEAQPPRERTELRVLYDDHAVYVAVRCFDAHPDAVIGRLTRRDRDLDGDKIAVEISSKNDRASAYHFQVSAAGVQVDGVRFNDTELDPDWDGRWSAAARRDALGWTAELEIPLVTLRYAGGETSFGFQVRRYRQDRGEIDEWAYIPRTVKGEVSYYGTLDGLTGLNARRLVELLPYASRNVSVRARQGRLDGTDTTGNYGADLKLGVTPALTLDGTINPDFGTVEVDSVVVNLSTLETYFPEKRRFFLEGAELFATPFKLFYSRRIGAQPPDPTLGPGAELAEPVPAGRIWSALKLTGLVSDRLSIAVLDAVTGRRDAAIARSPGGPAESVLVEPLSNFAVLRLRQEFGTNSSIGVTATAVQRAEPAGAAAPRSGDLCPVPYATTFRELDAPPPRDGRCTSDAYTAGLDTTLRSSDGEWGASAQVIGSALQHGPTRLVPDGTPLGAGATGLGILSEAGRYGGEHWLYKIGYSAASPRLQINDAGFLDQANFHDLFGSLTWRTTRPTEHFQSAALELYVEHRRDWALRDNLYSDPHLTATVELANFWTIEAEISPYYPRWFENRETEDGARTERGSGGYYALELATDPKQPFVASLSSSLLKVYGGLTSLRATATLSLRPIPALELDLVPDVHWSTGSPRWITTETNPDASRTYYFGILDARSFGVTLQGTYTFTRSLSLQAYVQPFFLGGHYDRFSSVTASGSAPRLARRAFVDATLPPGVAPDFRDGSLNVNLFLRWEYLPLSVLWLVYTRSQVQTDYDPAEGAGRIRLDPLVRGPATDTLLVKLSYLWF